MIPQGRFVSEKHEMMKEWMFLKWLKGIDWSLTIKQFIIFPIKYFPDEDISGDHILAEARVNLVKIFPQMQKQFQVCLHKPTFKVRNILHVSDFKHVIKLSNVGTCIDL